MEEKDIRWIQRYDNYKKALNSLSSAVEISKDRPLSDLEEQGLIQAFEYTFELAWNVMKDFFEYQAEEGIRGSRDAIRLAFNRGLIAEGHIWMDMIESRIKSSHTYNEGVAHEITEKVLSNYHKCFIDFKNTMIKEL